MKIVLPRLPNTITGFSFSYKKIKNDQKTIEYLHENYNCFFGKRLQDAAALLGVNEFDLVFINDRTFYDVFFGNFKKELKRGKISRSLKFAFLLRLMNRGEKVSMCSVDVYKGHAVVSEPEYCFLLIENEPEKNNKIKKKENKYVKLGARARNKIESIRLCAMKYGMKEALSYKKLIDKYNRRRFSKNLKLNNRPSDIEEINKMFREKKELSYTDLSQTSNRINFSVLFAIAYGGLKLEDIYGKDVIFEKEDEEKEKKISDLTNAMIGIINNGNQIEIAHTYINMINAFTKIDPPYVDMKDLSSVMDNYSIYHACAYLAAICENIFKLNNDLKLYMKKHNIYNYWNYVEKVLLMKEYSTVVSFCRTMSDFDANAYATDHNYQDEILFSFEKAFKFSGKIKELKDREKGDKKDESAS